MPKSSRTRRTPISLSALSVRPGGRRLLDQDALGDLESQVLGVEPGAGKDLRDRGGEIPVGDLAGREIDGDVEGPGVRPLPVPLEHLAAGGFLDPAPDRLDQPAVLGDGDELGGFEQPAMRVPPPDQRLEAGDLATGKGDHGLVVKEQLLAVDSLAQLLLELETAQGAGAHLGVEELRTGATLFLGPVHRRVRVADQHVRIGRLASGRSGDRDPEAGADEVLGALDRVGVRECARDAIGDRDRLVLVGEPIDQDAELVTAEAGDDVPGAQVRAQTRRDGTEQLVAGMVAEAVVDQLEVVEVEEDDPDRRTRDGRPFQRLGERCRRS